MAKIVLGAASSHSPQLSTEPGVWRKHAARDEANPALFGREGRFASFQELSGSAPAQVATQVNDQVWQEVYGRSQAALSTVREAISAADADVVIIVGDDEHEMFLDDAIPALALFLGDELWDIPPSQEELDRLPTGLAEANWARHAQTPDRYLTPASFNAHLAGHLAASGFDVCTVRRQAEGRSLGHAFTFVRRCLGVAREVSLAPVFLNTYFPPNVLSSRRAYRLGLALREAVQAWPEPWRVVVVASGGLSHFVVDEVLDRAALAAMDADDVEALVAACDGKLQSGNSEILNWVVACGMLQGFSMQLVDYLPAYRSTAGTGVGLGFALWHSSGDAP